MFTKKAYRKRTYIALFYSFLGQSTGVLVLNNYGPSFYSALGYGLQRQLVFQAGWVTVGYPFCFLGAVLMDRAGRRPLMMGSIAGCCVCVAVLAAATARVGDNGSIAALGVAAIYIFIAIYSIGVDVGGNVFYAEVFQNHVRAKGVALANAVLALSDLVYLELTPTAQAQVGWKWFLVSILPRLCLLKAEWRGQSCFLLLDNLLTDVPKKLFICISAFGTVVLYFVLPETKGVSLERMARIFGDEEGTGADTEGPQSVIRQQEEGSRGGGVSISSTEKETPLQHHKRDGQTVIETSDHNGSQ